MGVRNTSRNGAPGLFWRDNALIKSYVEYLPPFPSILVVVNDSPADPRVSLTPRAAEIAKVARELLEEEGLEALSMRNIGARLGIRAASLYEHFADKRGVENAIAAATMWEQGDVTRAYLEAHPDEHPALGVLNAFREYTLAHPQLYRLLMSRDLDRDAPDVREAEVYCAAPLAERFGDQIDVLLAMWAFAHGVLDLELTGRLGSLPVGTSHEEVWNTGMQLFSGVLEPASAAKS